MDAMREWAEEMLQDVNPEALFMDGLDGGIIGVTTGQPGMEAVVVYDEDLIVGVLMEDESFSEEDCWDHYGFNIHGAYVGPHTPIIIKRPPKLDGDIPGASPELE